jgi:hypothetical protein
MKYYKRGLQITNSAFSGKYRSFLKPGLCTRNVENAIDFLMYIADIY